MITVFSLSSCSGQVRGTMEQIVVASLHKHRRTTLERIEKYISHNQFKDINLRSKLFPEAKEVDSMLTLTASVDWASSVRETTFMIAFLVL